MTLRALYSPLRSRAKAPRSYRPAAELLEDRRLMASVLLVDDDHAQAPNAQYTTISAAVAAAHPGDTIRVYTGTYHESVTVNKTLNIVAESKKGAVVVDPGALGSGFDVQANDVKITGFRIQDATGSPGINLGRAFSGADIEKNVLADNTFGIYLNSSGADRTIIRGNAFLHNNNPTGSASGNGIYSDLGVSNARIENNYFTGQTNAAMIFVGNGSAAQAQTDLLIRGNVLSHDAPIILVNTSDSRIDHNVSVASSGSGIFFGGGVHDVTVSHNVLRDGAFTGINLRTDTVNYPVAAGAVDTHNVIRDNVITGFGDSGIRLRDGATANVVQGNRVSGNGTNNDPTTGDGISLEGATNNVVRDNKADHNRRDGIRADAASTGNQILNNHLQGNGEHDAHDDSTGTATAGTANTWKGNSGSTQNRPGLLVEHGHKQHDGHDDDHDHDEKGKGKDKDKGHDDDD